MADFSQPTVLLSAKLTDMIQGHQTAANLLKKINSCFDKDLAANLIFNMIWLIIYIYVTTVALWKEWGNGQKNADLVIESMFLLVRLTFLSYSVNRIEFEVSLFAFWGYKPALEFSSVEYLTSILCKD